jgi:hypothetical protein
MQERANEYLLAYLVAAGGKHLSFRSDIDKINEDIPNAPYIEYLRRAFWILANKGIVNFDRENKIMLKEYTPDPRVFQGMWI